MKIVAHEEAAAVDVLAHGLDLGVGQSPVAHFHGVEPRPVVLIAVVEIHGLLGGAHVNARQAAQSRGEMAVGARVIRGPEDAAAALGPIHVEAEAAESVVGEVGCVGVHQAGESPFGFFLVVRRDRIVVVFGAWIFAPGMLEGGHHPQRTYSGQQEPTCFRKTHPDAPLGSSIAKLTAALLIEAGPPPRVAPPPRRPLRPGSR